MTAASLEHVVGAALVCAGSVVALGLVAAYLAWVISGRER